MGSLEVKIVNAASEIEEDGEACNICLEKYVNGLGNLKIFGDIRITGASNLDLRPHASEKSRFNVIL